MSAAVLLASSPLCFAAADHVSSPIQVETLIQSTSSWDGTPYKAYPAGQPQITVLKITIPPHTTMKWHSHPMPNGYILSGELGPHTGNANIRFIHPPGPIRTPEMTPHSLVQDRGVGQYPASDRRVIDTQTTFGHQLLQIAIAERKAQVPSHTQDDHPRPESALALNTAGRFLRTRLLYQFAFSFCDTTPDRKHEV